MVSDTGGDLHISETGHSLYATEGRLITGDTFKRKCPVHGLSNGYMTITADNFTLGVFCVHCWVESLDKAGVQRITEV